MNRAPSRPGIVTGLPGERLLGRQAEREVLDRLLEAARRRDGRVLVVHGEPGVGTTALLEYPLEAGHGFRVLRTVGVEGEMELPVLGAVTAPTAVLIRPDGYVAWVGDRTQLGLPEALTTWFGAPAAA
jgi:AAA ATPase domain